VEGSGLGGEAEGMNIEHSIRQLAETSKYGGFSVRAVIGADTCGR